MSVPNTFATATTAIPLANLDANFAYYDAAFSISGTSTTFLGGITLNTGTANGVAYLNGSKVVTTGSALTFDGTNLGIGGAANNYGASITYQSIYGSTAAGLDFYNGATRNGALYVTSGDVNISAITNLPIRFQINGSEQMRLTSTGLGIGTSSPQARLNVADASSANNGTIWLGSATYYGTLKHNATGTGANEYNVATASGGGHLFQRGGTTLMNLDQNGQLGLGATPSTTAGAWKALEIVNNGNCLVGGYGEIDLVNNLRADRAGGFSFVNTAYASRFVQSSGVFSWYSGTGSAGANAASLNQVLQLDSSGNLGLGVTPSAWYSSFKGLDVANAAYYGNINNGTALITGNTYINSSLVNIYKTSNYALRYTMATDVGQHIWQIAPSGTAGNAITFTQAMTLDASGRLSVGATSQLSASKIYVKGALTTIENGIGIETTETGTSYLMTFYKASLVGSITYNGTLTTYNTTSDYRLKNVIGAVTGSGERIDALEPVEYTWKENGKHTRGFLAHDFAKVYADSVVGEKDAVDADNKPVYQSMQAGSPEVIADLVAEIKSLRARVAALEAK